MKINVSMKTKTSFIVHAFADLFFILYFFPEIRDALTRRMWARHT